MATIRERRKGVWEVRAYTGRNADGRPVQVSRTVRGGRRDAERMAAELTLKPSRSAGRSVADLLQAWLEVKTPAWASSTHRDAVSRVALIEADPIARLPVARLSVSDVDRWVARMRTAGVGESSIRNRHQSLRSALSQAVRWEWISVNSASSAPLQRARRLPRGVMATEDVRAVIEAAAEVHPMAPMALRLAAASGARRSELAGLRWDRIDDDRITIDRVIGVVRERGERGRPTLVEQPTKTANQRTVAIDAATAATLVELRAERESYAPWLFSDTDGPPHPDRIGWWWRRSRELADIDAKWRLHDLRHWSATQAIASGTDVRTVATRLGHADASMTLRVYAHALKNADADLAEQLGNELDGS